MTNPVDNKNQTDTYNRYVLFNLVGDHIIYLFVNSHNHNEHICHPVVCKAMSKDAKQRCSKLL